MRNREKKITVKYVLHDKVKPFISEDNEKLYPLYIQVIYDKKTTRFPYLIDGDEYRYSTRERFADETLPVNKLKFIHRIIEDETKKLRNKKYTLKGLSTRISIYETTVVGIFARTLLKELREYLKDILTYRQYINMDSHFDKEAFKEQLVFEKDGDFYGHDIFIVTKLFHDYYYGLEMVNLLSSKFQIPESFIQKLDSFKYYFIFNLCLENIEQEGKVDNASLYDIHTWDEMASDLDKPILFQWLVTRSIQKKFRTFLLIKLENELSKQERKIEFLHENRFFKSIYQVETTLDEKKVNNIIKILNGLILRSKEYNEIEILRGQ